MALLGSTLNPTEPIPSPSPQPEPEPEPEPEPRAAVAAARTPSPRASADGGAEDGSTPASSATKIYIETRVERKIPLQPGERCEFAVAVRDGMTVETRRDVWRAVVCVRDRDVDTARLSICGSRDGRVSVRNGSVRVTSCDSHGVSESDGRRDAARRDDLIRTVSQSSLDDVKSQ